MTDNAHILPDMTWPEAKAALAEAELAIIPTGSFEQHGPHMTFEVDTARAYEFGRLLAARLYPRVVLAPPVNMGVSYHHMNFPGTISLRPETFQAVIYDTVTSLQQHGISKFLLLNGHGGNIPSLGVIVVRLKQELGAQVAWTSFTSLARDVIKERATSEVMGHSCESETSQAMYLAPRVVREDRLAAGELLELPYRHLREGYNLVYPYAFDEITANGALGDATQASYEFGQAIVEAALQRATEFLEDFMDHPAGGG